MSFFEAINTCLVKKYFTFSGRATRSEFWWFKLFTFLVLYGSIFLGVLIYPNNPEVIGTTYAILTILLIIPRLSVAIRRLHDAETSGWFIFFCLIPVIGPFILLSQYLSPSVPETTDENDQQVVQ